ncbi:MAG: phosphopantetheine-binding protein [Coriobacteriales bacterium]|jgi:acyl carrier protein|nr:phosphopantetheine-binding protein [Coriobacteriales bacterium]
MDTIDSTAQDALAADEQDSVIARIKQLVIEIIGEDIAEFLSLNENSSFVLDLEMDSIQVVRFAELVNEHYGDDVDFIGWLSTKPMKEVLGLTVRDVASFIESSISAEGSAAKSASRKNA